MNLSTALFTVLNGKSRGGVIWVAKAKAHHVTAAKGPARTALCMHTWFIAKGQQGVIVLPFPMTSQHGDN